MHFRRQAQYKRHVHQRCLEVRALISWEGLHFGSSHLQFWEDDFVSQSQHFVWPGLTFSWQAQDFRDMDWKNRKTQWHKAVSSALNFPLLKEISQNCFVFDVIKIKSRGSLPKLLRFLCCHLQKWRKLSRIASFLMLSQLQDNMPREFASKNLESLCLGIVDVTSDARGTDSCCWLYAFWLLFYGNISTKLVPSVCRLHFQISWWFA